MTATLWHLDKVAVVTGAAKGIGFVIADRLARDGASLVVADLDAEGLAAAASRLEQAHGRAIETFAGNLADEQTAVATIERAVSAFGRIDILVNNAGGGIIRPFLEHTPQTLKETIDRNLWTTIWCSWRAAPLMRAARFGRIINIGADSVRNGLWDHAAYNAAKGGVHGLTTGLARELAPMASPSTPSRLARPTRRRCRRSSGPTLISPPNSSPLSPLDDRRRWTKSPRWSAISPLRRRRS